MIVPNAALAWSAALTLVTALFCIARGITDIRQRRLAWGVVGLMIGLVVASSLIASTSVKIDLPPAAR
jgi:hypothetical protein